MNTSIVHRFAQLGLMRNTPADVLVAQRQIAVNSIGRAAGAVNHMIQRHLPLHLVLDIATDIAPGFDFHVMGIGIDDDDVVKIIFLALELAVGKNISGVGLGCDFLDRYLTGRFEACIHGFLLICPPMLRRRRRYRQRPL